jgi:hypothetical protein
MLIFIDESWQDVGDHSVGALGAVAFEMRAYNGFCREFFSIKREELGAQELNEVTVQLSGSGECGERVAASVGGEGR